MHLTHSRLAHTIDHTLNCVLLITRTGLQATPVVEFTVVLALSLLNQFDPFWHVIDQQCPATSMGFIAVFHCSEP